VRRTFTSGLESNVGSLGPLRRATVSAPKRFHAGGVRLPRVAAHSGLLASKPIPNTRQIPERLRIEAIGVDAAIRPVGVSGRTTRAPTDVDDVFVRTRDGSSSVFSVIARRSYAIVASPDRLFTRTGPAMLALVTCGGRFPAMTGRYENNVVIYVIPRE
jgi:hypothetical protein